MESVGSLLPSDTVWGYCRNVAAIFGAAVLGRLVVSQLLGLLNGFRAFFLAPMGIGRLNLKKYGDWAVVTGASEGIGRGYALELARRGLNVVLMSRSEEKLNKVAIEIKEKYGRDTRVIPVDFSDGFEIYAPLAEELSSLDIGVLVNNVGMGHPTGHLSLVEPERLYKVAQTNCQAIVQMSRIMLPKMTAKGGGVIVNLSSLVHEAALPKCTTYCASKIFDTYVSHGLRKEYRAKGIIVQNVTPALVATPMARDLGGIRGPSIYAADPVAFTRAAVATIGIQEDTYGCFSHALQGYVARNTLGLVAWLSSFATPDEDKRSKNK